MYAPTYISEPDRLRLLEINSYLHSGVTFGQIEPKTPKELADMEQERRDIESRRKDLPDCTYEELQDLRRQVFAQFQKHASIGSNQTGIIGMHIRQIEFRAALLMNQDAEKARKKLKDDVANDDATSKSTRRVSTKRSTNSWTIDFDE